MVTRPEGDIRDDRLVKEEIYRREIEGKYNGGRSACRAFRLQKGISEKGRTDGDAEAMTDAEMISHIATRIMGWTVHDREKGWPTEVTVFGKPDRQRAICWNPIEDLNACAEFEAKLTKDQRMRYMEALSASCYLSETLAWAIVTATPRQRCLAAVLATK